ncbi:uncharacterized protein LOC129755905 isoform X2 [Uranotaenia lowii]|uniref:uncharacterized protein LOC129755905 isoform X2 n=1 Tax=Uranotaenia lowii TaxID=190385 RepID=UPI0024793530|nr:uncharacterized protein LOC129755905 isoform X2 [Uranotaenia lowii]
MTFLEQRNGGKRNDQNKKNFTVMEQRGFCLIPGWWKALKQVLDFPDNGIQCRDDVCTYNGTPLRLHCMVTVWIFLPEMCAGSLHSRWLCKNCLIALKYLAEDISFQL